MTANEQLLSRVSPVLGQAIAEALVAAVDPHRSAAVLALLAELQECSGKVATAAVHALPELQRRAGLEQIEAWLDLGVVLADTSGAAALKYYTESPLILSLIPPVRRRGVLHCALELADPDGGNASAALEFFRSAVGLSAVLPPDALERWAEAGMELSRCDYVVGIEFFRQAPAIAGVIAEEDLRSWIALGLKLVTQNSLGKPDYLGTLELFRTSPAVLADVDPSIRGRVITLCSALADRSPETAILVLAEAPRLLQRMPASWRLTVLQYALLVAERDAEAAMQYLRRCPELLELIDTADTPDKSPESDRLAAFESWFKTGMEVLAYSSDGGRSYFALETRKALASIEQAITGVPLRQVTRTLKLFAEALSGRDIMIRPVDSPPIPSSSDKEPRDPVRAMVSPDGRTISLPPILRRYPTREQNIRLYTVMTAHEAGHLEYGTYALDMDRLGRLAEEVHTRYGHESQTPPRTLAQLFEQYPQPRLMQDLWTVLEDARVEFRLGQDYLGLRQDLATLAREAVTMRSLQHGLSVRELVVDTLLLLSTAEPGSIRIPEGIRDLIDPAWAWCQSILKPTATAEEVVRLADRIYVLLEERVGKATANQPAAEMSATTPPVDQGLGPQASEELSTSYRPVTNWAYRGTMDSEMIRRQQVAAAQGDEAPAMPQVHQHRQGRMPLEATRSDEDRGRDRSRGPNAEPLSAGVRSSSVIEKFLAPDVPQQEIPQAADGHAASPDRVRESVYGEWDGAIADYREAWCRVRERRFGEGSNEFAAGVRATHGPMIRLLRRYFESIRPAEWRRLRGQLDGEEVDLDAAICRFIEQKAGVEPSDRVYLHREKRERSVAAAFLVDLSGSTSRKVGSQGRRIIDVEREGLVLLGEALEAVGDQFAVYGYSGTGRQAVDFWVLKEFDEQMSCLASRIGAMMPLHQNRDGAAIRHATRKLLAQDVKVRLLVLLSDGRPLDDGYAGEYSLEDTKMALREARARGVEPFCITVDREADEYASRMYGEVDFVVIDQVETLPAKLPRIYRRLTT
jgi:nitric oxide reductase NorD protein